MKVIFEKECFRRIKGFTKLAEGEVAGMARVENLKGNFHVHDLKLLPNQEVSGGSVDLQNDSLVGLLLAVENPQEFKFLWHSHASMGTFISQIDKACIDGFLETSQFLISCVSNKKGDILIQLDAVVNEMRLSTKLDYSIGKDIEEYSDLEPELDANVKEKLIVTGFGTHGLFEQDLIDLDDDRDVLDEIYGTPKKEKDKRISDKEYKNNVIKRWGRNILGF